MYAVAGSIVIVEKLYTTEPHNISGAERNSVKERVSKKRKQRLR